MNPQEKILLFDIDGTLLHTGGVGRIAFEKIFEEQFAVREAWGGLIPDGKTDPVIFEEIALRVLKRPLTPEEYTRLSKIYTDYFREMIPDAPNFRLMPGVSQLLATLSKISHWHLGIQTGNFEEVAWLKLQRGKLNHHFSFGGFGSDSRHREGLMAEALKQGEKKLKKSISPRHAFVIGDAPQDILAGKKLGLRTIAVTTGHSSYETLRNCRPAFLCKDLTDIPRFMAMLG